MAMSPFTTNFQQLLDAGVALPAPESLDDEAIAKKLWEIIEALADLGVILDRTDHLSDRALYEQVWVVSCVTRWRTCRWLTTNGPTSISLGPVAMKDLQLYLKYYADDRDREHWRQEAPDLQIPEHEDPPFDRDRHLPGRAEASEA